MLEIIQFRKIIAKKKLISMANDSCYRYDNLSWIKLN